MAAPMDIGQPQQENIGQTNEAGWMLGGSWSGLGFVRGGTRTHVFSRLLCLCCGVASAELSTMWRVRKTIHAMLAERGYLLTQDDMTMTMEDFKATFGDSPKYVDALPTRAACVAAALLQGIRAVCRTACCHSGVEILRRFLPCSPIALRLRSMLLGSF